MFCLNLNFYLPKNGLREVIVKLLQYIYRSSRLEVFCGKGVLRNFVKFTTKHLGQSLFFNKVAGLNFIKKETLVHVFSCEFCEISKNGFFYRTPPVAASASSVIAEEKSINRYWDRSTHFA